ncbi:MAG: hypothetical protein QOJ59_4144 [Thermomicrobiales bacterium]|jgi:hypothetical protein|nr:hypothetical protein [Thermomicrobiales bacterium]
MIGRRRLALEDVEPSAEDATRAERLAQTPDALEVGADRLLQVLADR